MTRKGRVRWRRLRCAGCGASVAVPVEPWQAQPAARRIAVFRARHQRHLTRPGG